MARGGMSGRRSPMQDRRRRRVPASARTARERIAQLKNDVEHVAAQVEDFLNSPTAQHASDDLKQELETAVQELSALFSNSPQKHKYKMPDMTYTRKQIKEAVVKALKETKSV